MIFLIGFPNDRTKFIHLDSDSVAELLIERGANVNKANNVGSTPLMRAVLRSTFHSVALIFLVYDSIPQTNIYFIDSEKIVKLLISSGADLNAVNNDLWSVLHSVAQNGELYNNIINLSTSKWKPENNSGFFE